MTKRSKNWTWVSSLMLVLAAASSYGQSLKARTVSAFSADHIIVHAVKGKLVHVVVVGDGDTDLDLYAYDRNGRMLMRDIDGTIIRENAQGRRVVIPADIAEVRFRAPYTGSYRLKVNNLGAVYNRYLLYVE